MLRTSFASVLIGAVLAAGCYRHPDPVDGGGRDAQVRDAPPADAPPDDAPPDDAPPLDAPGADAWTECTSDDDCDTACATGTCTAGTCVREPIDDGTACDDGDLCTTGATCIAGECGTRATCGACTADGFVTTFDAEWSHEPRAAITTDGGWALVGAADGDVWLGSLGADGAIAFEQRFGEAPGLDEGYAIARARTGEIVIAGSTSGETLVNGWIAVVDAETGAGDGEVTVFSDRAGSVQGIAPQADGSHRIAAVVAGRATIARVADDVVSGERGYFDVGSTHGLVGPTGLAGGDFVIAGDVGAFPDRSVRAARIRPGGDVLWEQTLDAEEARAIVALDDGSVVVAGRSLAGAAGSAWIARLDPAGEVAWQRFYGTDRIATVASIARAPDGGFVLASGSSGDAWVIRTDADGTFVEDARIDLGGYEQATIVLSDATGVLVAGNSDQPGDLPIVGWAARVATVADLACPAD